MLISEEMRPKMSFFFFFLLAHLVTSSKMKAAATSSSSGGAGGEWRRRRRWRVAAAAASSGGGSEWRRVVALLRFLFRSVRGRKRPHWASTEPAWRGRKDGHERISRHRSVNNTEIVELFPHYLGLQARKILCHV
jgi:hypothetical protein